MRKKFTIRCKKAILALALSAGLFSSAIRPIAAQAATTTQTAATTYKSPIDFTSLKAANPEVYAWLSIPGTNISYPLCQARTDDTFYLTHNHTGALDVNGALFTEHTYNGKDFTDPVTVIYGHNMKSGKMFGYLQETYSKGLTGRKEAIIYLPNKELHYDLYCARTIASGHLLAGRNYYKAEQFQALINDIARGKSLDAVMDTSVQVKTTDKLLILSTCIGGQPDNRYIVVGRLK